MSDRVVFICVVLMAGTFFLLDAVFAATKEERKAERRAEEARYMVCLQECREKCGGWK